MKQKTLQILEKSDAFLDDMLEKLKDYPDEILNRKPSPGEWSAMNVLQHLMRSERLSYGYVRKKLSYNPKLKRANIGTAWRTFLLDNYNRFPMKWKAPAAVSEEHFPEYGTLDEVKDQWRQQRHQLKEYLEGLPDHIFNKELYKHPIAGRVTIVGMINFFNGHMIRHNKQIDRTLAKLK